MRHSPCPRCQGQLIAFEEHEKSCLQCGYIEHRRDLPFFSRLLGREVGSVPDDHPGAKKVHPQG